MKANLIRKEYLIYASFLTIILLITVYSTTKSKLIFDIINDHIAQQAQDIQAIKSEIRSKRKPLIILREEFKFVFPDPSVPTSPKKSKHHREKRDGAGLLSADEISAHNIKTNKMFAKHVKADIVKAERVNAVVISVGKAFSVNKAKSPRGTRDNTLILNRDGPDPTDTTVTIVLERSDDPVSINGHPSHEKEKHDLLKLKNDLNRRRFDQSENNKNGKPKTLQRPKVKYDEEETSQNFVSKRNDSLSDLDRQKLIMLHWRQKLVDYMKRRETNIKSAVTIPDHKQATQTFVNKKTGQNIYNIAETSNPELELQRNRKVEKPETSSSDESDMDDYFENFYDSFEREFDSNKQSFSEIPHLKTFERREDWFNDNSEDIFYDESNNYSDDFYDRANERETFDEYIDEEYEVDSWDSEDEETNGKKDIINKRLIDDDFLSSKNEFYSDEKGISLDDNFETRDSLKKEDSSENNENRKFYRNTTPSIIQNNEDKSKFIQNPQNIRNTTNTEINRSASILKQTIKSEVESEKNIFESEDDENSDDYYYSNEPSEYLDRSDVTANLYKTFHEKSQNKADEKSKGQILFSVNEHLSNRNVKNNLSNNKPNRAHTKTDQRFFSESAEEWFEDSDVFDREFKILK